MNRCETCIHFEVCNKKDRFEKLMNEIESVKLSDGVLLLETKEFNVNVQCKHYQIDYGKVYDKVYAKGGIIKVGE